MDLLPHLKRCEESPPVDQNAPDQKTTVQFALVFNFRGKNLGNIFFPCGIFRTQCEGKRSRLPGGQLKPFALLNKKGVLPL